MRALVDMVDSFAGIVRFVIGGIFLIGFLVAFMLTAGASYVAPKVAEDFGDRASELGELAIEEARDARRQQALAKDGWGYDDQSSKVRTNRSDGFGSRDLNGDEVGGWGD